MSLGSTGMMMPRPIVSMSRVMKMNASACPERRLAVAGVSPLTSRAGEPRLLAAVGSRASKAFSFIVSRALRVRPSWPCAESQPAGLACSLRIGLFQILLQEPINLLPRLFRLLLVVPALIRLVQKRMPRPGIHMLRRFHARLLQGLLEWLDLDPAVRLAPDAQQRALDLLKLLLIRHRPAVTHHCARDPRLGDRFA